MTFKQQICDRILKKKSPICVGLDPDFSKIPSHIPKTIEGLKYFLESIMAATSPYCVAFKPNISFFEALGIPGLNLLSGLREKCPSDVLWIIDAKRGDIGNTSAMQARFIYDHLGADATTLHPYMGEDSVAPFLAYHNKLSFVLGLTSNPGSATFEKQVLQGGMPLWAYVVTTCKDWNVNGNVGVVLGGTNVELREARALAPNLPFLIPGVGTQGGDFKTVYTDSNAAVSPSLINMSRSVLYADPSIAFALGAELALKSLLNQL